MTAAQKRRRKAEQRAKRIYYHVLDGDASSQRTGECILADEIERLLKRCERAERRADRRITEVEMDRDGMTYERDRYKRRLENAAAEIRILLEQRS